MKRYPSVKCIISCPPCEIRGFRRKISQTDLTSWMWYKITWCRWPSFIAGNFRELRQWKQHRQAAWPVRYLSATFALFTQPCRAIYFRPLRCSWNSSSRIAAFQLVDFKLTSFLNALFPQSGPWFRRFNVFPFFRSFSSARTKIRMHYLFAAIIYVSIRLQSPIVTIFLSWKI